MKNNMKWHENHKEHRKKEKTETSTEKKGKSNKKGKIEKQWGKRKTSETKNTIPQSAVPPLGSRRGQAPGHTAAAAPVPWRRCRAANFRAVELHYISLHDR